MGNSLLSIQPHKVSTDLRGYSVMFYGAPKSGKTTIASQFPGALLLAFEKGYSALPGVMAKPINSWNEFKKTLKELEDPEVKEMFQTVVIDTADIAYDYNIKYVCDMLSDINHSYENIADVPYGKGYNAAMKEFDECLRKIINMGYGLVIISHSQDKTFTDAQGNEYSQICPTLDKRARIVCERACDIIGYSRAIDTEEGTVTKLFLRGTQRFVAGSRFKYTPDVIDFTYDNLVNAIRDAIEQEAQVNKNYVTDQAHKRVEAEVLDFTALKEEFGTITQKLMASNDPNVAKTISHIVDAHLGKGKKVSECVEENASQLDLIIYDLKSVFADVLK